MAYDYEKAKQLYQGMNREQQQQFVDQNKNDANFQRFMGDYMNEINGKSTTTQQATQNNANSNIGSGTNGQNSIQETANNINNEVNAGAEQIKKQQEVINKNQKLLEQEQNQYDPNETLQTDKFQQTDKGVVVKEGTAAQTGKPDYQLDSDARTQEITNNLNSYYQTNPEYFKDRNTFNSIFHYNERSDSQKALLDSYWGKTKLSQSTAQYGTPKAITEGLNNYDITEEQLNFLKDNSPDVYQQWQEAQQEKINLWISNDSRLDVADLTSQLTKIQEGLNLVSKSYNLIQTYEDKMQEYDVIGKMNDYNNYVNKIDGKVSEKEAIIRKYSNAGADTMGGAAANFARMQRALAPINSTLSDYYQVASMKQQGYQMAFAQAKQDVAVVQAQAQEDQRVFNNNLQALGFAMDVMDYRTPEQKMQMQLQQQYMSGQISLLQQSQMNDINRYNQYATAKMQSQLNYDLTDLSVSDPKQLKTNLNNVLSEYYNAYGDIIKRSQSETLNDVLKYAEENNVSVAEALRKNFIEPLQGKQEYKNAIASKYQAPQSEKPASYSTIKINGKDYLQINGQIVDPATLGIDGLGDTKPYNIVSESDMVTGVNLFKQQHPSGKGGQCGKFVNDYLVSIGVTGATNRFYDNDLSTKLNSRNTNVPSEGSIAIFDYNHLSSDGINHGHVAIVTKTYEDGSFDIIESNKDGDEMIGTRHVPAGQSSTKGFFNPSLNSSSTQGYDVKSPYEGISGYTNGGVAVNNGGWVDSLEEIYTRKRANQKEMETVLSDYGITQVEFNAQKKRYMDYVEKTQIVNSTLDALSRAEKLKEWAEKEENKNLHNGYMDKEIAESGTTNSRWQWLWTSSDTVDNINEGYALYKNLTENAGFDKYLQMKTNGAQFGIMTDSEWNKIDNSVSPLKWMQSDATFMANLNDMINGYNDVLNKLGYDFGEKSKVTKASDTSMGSNGTGSVITGGANTGASQGLISEYRNGRMMYSADGGKTRL